MVFLLQSLCACQSVRLPACLPACLPVSGGLPTFHEGTLGLWEPGSFGMGGISEAGSLSLTCLWLFLCLSLTPLSFVPPVSELLEVTKTREQLLSPESKLPTPRSLVIESAGGQDGIKGLEGGDREVERAVARGVCWVLCHTKEVWGFLQCS